MAARPVGAPSGLSPTALTVLTLSLQHRMLIIRFPAGPSRL